MQEANSNWLHLMHCHLKVSILLNLNISKMTYIAQEELQCVSFLLCLAIKEQISQDRPGAICCYSLFCVASGIGRCWRLHARFTAQQCDLPWQILRVLLGKRKAALLWTLMRSPQIACRGLVACLFSYILLHSSNICLSNCWSRKILPVLRYLTCQHECS